MGTRPASDFLAHPDNWRIHPANQQDALEGALDEVGWVQNVVVSVRTGRVLDGHLRVTLALRKGDDTPVPYVEVDVSEEEERLILATLDPIATLAAMDKEKFAEVLEGWNTGSAALQQMITDLAEKEGVFPSAPPSLDELENQYGEPEDTDFWPVLRIKVEPETQERYMDLMRRAPGEAEHEKFRAILEAVDADSLGAGS